MNRITVGRRMKTSRLTWTISYSETFTEKKGNRLKELINFVFGEGEVGREND